MKPYVYIASPYTVGNKEKNVWKSIEVAEELIEIGYVPFLPLLSHYWHIGSPHDYDYWMELDTDWLLKCDLVLRLPGESKGADQEVKRAIEERIAVVYSVDKLKWLKKYESYEYCPRCRIHLNSCVCTDEELERWEI